MVARDDGDLVWPMRQNFKAPFLRLAGFGLAKCAFWKPRKGFEVAKYEFGMIHLEWQSRRLGCSGKFLEL